MHYALIYKANRTEIKAGLYFTAWLLLFYGDPQINLRSFYLKG